MCVITKSSHTSLFLWFYVNLLKLDWMSKVYHGRIWYQTCRGWTFFWKFTRLLNLCGHAVGEHFVKVSTIISESVNQSSILYHWGSTYQTTRDVSEWVRHMPVDHRCQGHAHKILFHAWPGDNWGLFDVKKTIIWKKSAVSQVNGARASIQVPALLTQSHAFSCLSLPRNFLRKNSSDLQHASIKYLSMVNYHLQDVENLLSLLIFQVSNIMSGLHFTAFNAHHSMYIEVLYSCDRNSVILFMKLTAVIYPYEYLCFLNFECRNL